MSLSLGKQWFRSYFCCIGGWKTCTEVVRWSHVLSLFQNSVCVCCRASRCQTDDQISLQHKLWNIRYIKMVISFGKKIWWVEFYACLDCSETTDLLHQTRSWIILLCIMVTEKSSLISIFQFQCSALDCVHLKVHASTCLMNVVIKWHDWRS